MLLALESSCDETAAAVIRRGPNGVEVLASLVSSQIDLHREYGGVVPELASRNHAQRIRPLVEQTLDAAKVELSEIESFAATRGPGLASSLLVGLSYTKALALGSNRPFYGINHLEGHLLSPFLSDGEVTPHLGLIVSGGHTMTIDVRGYQDYRLVGRTIDDAAGEAYDKVARMLDLPYPGGPEIERLARSGNPRAFNFPRPRLKEAPLSFSFSGLKTAVLYQIEKLSNPRESLADLCASFQAAVVDSLLKKSLLAAEDSGHRTLAVSGGVACNQALQEQFTQACRKHDFTLKLAPPALTTDNAAMIAFAGLLASESGESDELDVGIDPSLSLLN